MGCSQMYPFDKAVITNRHQIFHPCLQGYNQCAEQTADRLPGVLWSLCQTSRAQQSSVESVSRFSENL